MGYTNNKPIIWITEKGTKWYPSVILFCKTEKMRRTSVFEALHGDGRLSTNPPTYVDYATEDYDVENEEEEM